MVNVEKKFLEDRKKISLNLHSDLLELVDDMSKVSKTNRTMILEAFVLKGIVGQLKYMEETWMKMKNDKSVDQTKLNQALSGLKAVKKKHKSFLQKL
ncbi:MAG: hypothetical protein ABIJ18_01595 [archaeon]